MACHSLYRMVGLLVLYGHLTYVTSSSNKTRITVGVLVPMTFGAFIAGVVPAFREVERLQLLPDYDIYWTLTDSGCTPYIGLRDAITVWRSEADLVAFVGHACSIVCQPVSLVAAAWNLPVVSYSCTSVPLSDKSQYPTFFRTVGHEAMSAPIAVATIQAFGWDRCVIVTTPEDLWTYGAIETKRLMEAAGIRTFYHVVNTVLNGNDVDQVAMAEEREIVKLCRIEARFIFVYMYSDELRMLMLNAYDEGMLDGTYIFYASEMIDILYSTPSYRPEISNPVLFAGFFSLFPEDFTGPAWEQLQRDTVEAFNTHRYFEDYPNVKDLQAEDISVYAGNAYESVIAWAHGANRTLEAGGSIRDGVSITKSISNFTFESATGTVVMNEHGDRERDQTVSIILPNSTVLELFKWFAVNHSLIKTYKPESASDWRGVIWAGGSDTVPSGQPTCGWDGELCIIPPVNQTLPAAIGGVSSLTLICLAIAIIFYIHKQHLRRLEEEEINKYQIDIADLKNCPSQSLARQNASEIALNNRDLDTNIPFTIVTDDLQFGQDSSAFFREGLVTVTIYPFKISGNNDIILRDEIKQVKGLSHENLAAFIGVCKQSSRILILSEYAPKGSLMDLLSDVDVQLTWDFKISFLSDISRGLRYIHHSDLGYHGALSSRCCVVDKRWTCKITHYGFASVRDQIPLQGRADSSLLYVAPEILREDQTTANPQTDVYAFGIIAQEVGTRSDPFCENTPFLELREILEAIKRGADPPYRPYIDPSSCPALWIELASECWNEDPSDRPSIQEITKMIIRINNGKKPRLVDTIIQNLEEHTSKLEDIVSERVFELNEERCRMDALLSELLPPSIANQLKSNQTIEPETFDSVTIFFSDIVGFTRVSAQSTPFQVVVMLNKLYSIFDQILSEHDVYKVATIGDAYMVASGVPIANGDKHAEEISAMSLAMIEAIQNFPIPHISGEQLYMRIGLHSGSCVAGVTGSKAPRYLLFGESVDKASRIEAGGEAMKVHLSHSTAVLLMKADRFKVLYRGEMPIKGMASIKTYWLVGQKESRA